MSWKPTDVLIQELNLLEHPEGGYFVETDQQTAQVPSPFSNNEPRSLGTSIYYLLTKDSPSGVIHMNKSVTYHVLHQGRAEYTLIHPTHSPKIEKRIMGTNVSAGEARLLLVGTGVWKMSQLLPKNLESGHGCLITEVVVPGFHWEDHKFLTMEVLVNLFEGVEESEKQAMIKKFERHVKKA
ncbi:hypothetical protein GYMLUDRAFT_38696 [Collybiopsis luxurians FD-317 M1]|nr:hypothetical protein GYMLUDRAFT_38696 [Collybiopsis luxurians FD-317 M1]